VLYLGPVDRWVSVTIWPSTRQSETILIVASACFTVARGGKIHLQLLDVRRDVRRPDATEFEIKILTPAEKIADGSIVRPPGIRVPNLGREELNEAHPGFLTGRRR
jgi:hypothetical protein